MDELDRLVERWFDLRDHGNEESAQELYQNRIFSMVRERVSTRFRREFPDIVGSCDLIQPVGLSQDPMIFMIDALKPQHIFFLYTQETEKVINIVAERAGLSPDMYNTILIEQKPGEIRAYRVVMRIRKEYPLERRVVVDITPGKKSMTGELALSAALYGFQIAYLDHDTRNRDPIPGSQRVKLITSPYDEYGELQLRMAIERINAGEYSQAEQILKSLQSSVMSHELLFTIDTLHQYCGMLRLWSNFEFGRAHEEFKLLEAKTQQFTSSLGWLKKRIHVHAAALRDLARTCDQQFFDSLRNTDTSISMILTMLASAIRHENEGRLPEATLRYYRTIELIGQHRIASTLGIDTSNADTQKINEDTIRLAHRINPHGDPDRVSASLPEKIGLLQTFALLLASRDEVVFKHLLQVRPQDEHLLEDPDKFVKFSQHYLRRLLAGIEARNNHVLIHGWVSDRDGDRRTKAFQKLHDLAVELARVTVEHTGRVFDDAIAGHTFEPLEVDEIL